MSSARSTAAAPARAPAARAAASQTSAPRASGRVSAERQPKPTGAKPGRALASRRGDVQLASFNSGATAFSGGSSYGGGLSCVPYARMVTGMDVSGNGGQWWYNAAGSYQRGQRPEPGSVLAFASSGGMRSGHVAVVERIVAPREITIHHANWGGPGIRRGTVMRNVSVVDVSEANDWTAVRVQVGHDNANYGRTYPTYGFIHNRHETGGVQMVRARRGATEVAEATPHLRFIGTNITLDGAGN